MSDVLNSLKKKNNKDEGQGKRLQEQLNIYFLKELKHFVVEKRLSYLCGFTKNYSGQYTYFSWKKKENYKKHLDKEYKIKTILMDISNAFETIKYNLPLSELLGYSFFNK